MKVQLQFDLGEIQWAARNTLEKGCQVHCTEDGKVVCDCPDPSFLFQVLSKEENKDSGCCSKGKCE